MKKITDFLKTKTSKEDLKSALSVLREFKSCEGEREWIDIPCVVWDKLEQLEEYLAYLVDGKNLSEETVEYMNDAADCFDGKTADFLKEELGAEGKRHKSLANSFEYKNFVGASEHLNELIERAKSLIKK